MDDDDFKISMDDIKDMVSGFFDKNNHGKKLKDIFVEYIAPSTTLKPGE